MSPHALLGEVVDFMRNGTTSPQNSEGRGQPISRIETISDGTINPDRVRHVELNENESTKWRLEQGDILLSHINSVNHIGKSASYKGSPPDLIHGMNLLLLRPNRNLITSEFLAFALKNEQFREIVRARCKRAINQASINQKDLASIPIRLPSLPEQHRVVDLLSRAEGIVRLRREAQRKATELMPAMFFDIFGDPAINPKGWPMVALGTLARFVSGGTPAKSRKDYWEGSLPWVSPKDMKSVVIDGATDTINDRVLEETTLKLIPTNSVLIVVRGMILAHTIPVAITSVPVTINQDMKALIASPEIDSTYLLWCLRVSQKWLLSKVDEAAHGTKKLDTARLVALPIPIPPINLQHKFAAKSEAVRSILAQQVDASATAQSAFDALLSRSFQH